MRLNRTAFSVLLATAFAAAACGDDDVTGSTLAELQGNYTASSITFTSQANQSRTLDITGVCATSDSDKCGGLTFNVNANGTATGVFSLPALTQAGIVVQDVPLTATVELTGDNSAHVDFTWPTPDLQADPPIDDFDATFVLNGNTLTFTRVGAMFTFPNGNGQPESSVLVITLVRA